MQSNKPETTVVPDAAFRSDSSTTSFGGSVLKIGHYKLGRTLGYGTFGKVKLAEHELLEGHQVAVKILNRKKIKTLNMDDKIRREIQILKLFRHPHIIKLYEVIETPKDIFMIMEFVPGGELFNHIVQHGKLSENEARRFFQQIIAGIEYCHHHMVVHRDLKPENLLLDENQCVKIADFGLSNIMRDGDFLKTSCGSPNYAAPEVISGDLYAGAEVDIWSCGVILYALLCGSLPFDDDYIPALFQKIKNGEFTVPTYVSPSCKDLICSMLRVDPLKRITIEEIRVHPWFSANLPGYLKNPPQQATTRHITSVDDNVIAQLMQRMDLTDAERTKSMLTDLKKYKNSPEATAVRVAYHLIIDRMEMEKIRKDLEKNKKVQVASSSASSSNKQQQTDDFEAQQQRSLAIIGRHHTPNKKSSQSNGKKSFLGTTPTMNLRVGKSLLEYLALDEPNLSKSFDASNMEVTAMIGTNRTWTLGIVSRLSAKEIMIEALRTLKKLDFRWKFMSPYSIRCRKTFLTSNGAQQHYVKMALQLYKIEKSLFLLDFKKLDGEIFPFFEVSAQLLNEYSRIFHIPSISSTTPKTSRLSFSTLWNFGFSG
mmetsp:Transcript_12544/g.18959  ORF Transcript_12544/g.18959 Transcript_12544/m.18959 type:complete len:596 (-) Transcript_12544:19-1806(-)